MSAIPRISLLLSAMVLPSLAPGPAAGQPADDGPGTGCELAESLTQCYDRLVKVAEAELDEIQVNAPELSEEKAEELVQTAARKVEEKATPSTNPGASTALLDFLPRLAGALGIDGASDSQGNLTFGKVFGPGALGSLKVGATVFTDAELFEPLETKLAEDAEEGVVSQLQNGIGDFDKVDFQASFTREGYVAGKRFGRRAAQYRPLVQGLAASWLREKLSDGPPPFAEWRSSKLAEDAVRAYQRKAPEGETRSLLTVPIEELAAEDALGTSRVAELEASLVSLVEDHVAFVRTMDLGDELDQLDELVANQPQLVVVGTYRERRNLTGPDEWTGSLSYEIGLSGNLNDFLTWAGKADNQGAECRIEDGHPSLDCLESYLESETFGLLQQVPEGVKAERGNRLEVTAEYKKTSAFRPMLPDEELAFELEPSEVLSGSLTYARYLPSFRLPNLSTMTALDDVDPQQLARFDLEAKYDDVSGDPMRQSRLTVTGTVTQKTTDNSALSVSLVWANKPEYLGEVDEELSANLGLKWQLDNGGR